MENSNHCESLFMLSEKYLSQQTESVSEVAESSKNGKQENNIFLNNARTKHTENIHMLCPTELNT